jgi:hypothetical protein
MKFVKKEYVKNYLGIKLNDTRTVTKFLWFPKTIGDTTIWLEKATWVETAKFNDYYDLEWVQSHWVVKIN